MTPKQEAWQAYKTAKRAEQPLLKWIAVISAPKGSPIRAYRRAVAVLDGVNLNKKLSRKVRKAIARGTRLARSRQ